MITKSAVLSRGDDYLEIDMNIFRFSYVCKKGLQHLMGRIPDFHLHLSMTLEGRSDDELPEQVVFAIKLRGFDLRAYGTAAGSLPPE
jgi:hypothetical protein